MDLAPSSPISSTSTIDNILLVASLLLLFSVLLSKLSGRLGLPALLIFMGIGMLAGSEGPGGIAFENYALTQGIGILALAFILFDGGVNTEWSKVKPVALPGILLSSIGAVLTALLVSLPVRLAFRLVLDGIFTSRRDRFGNRRCGRFRYT